MAQLDWDATADSRPDLYLPAWDPACEWRWNARDWGALGFDEAYHGHEGVVRSVQHWNTIWTDISFTVREILDGGDTFLMRVTLSGSGGRSGAAVQREFSSVARLDPLLVEFENFLDDAEALRAAGF